MTQKRVQKKNVSFSAVFLHAKMIVNYLVLAALFNVQIVSKTAKTSVVKATNNAATQSKCLLMVDWIKIKEFSLILVLMKCECETTYDHNGPGEQLQTTEKKIFLICF